MAWYEFEGQRPRVDAEAFVHPEATLIGNVEIAANCYIGAGAVLRGDLGLVKIGKGSNVQENCVLHTFPDDQVILGPNTHIGHGCILHGCQIGSNVLVGMGSTVADGARIGGNCLVGACSFVRFGEEIPENSLVVGNPAKVAGEITDEHLLQIKSSLEIYQKLAKRYCSGFRRILTATSRKDPVLPIR